jgi:hypothetical protein
MKSAKQIKEGRRKRAEDAMAISMLLERPKWEKEGCFIAVEIRLNRLPSCA